MLHTQFSYETSTELAGVAFCALRHMLLKHAKAANSKVLEDSECLLSLAGADCHLNLCTSQAGKPSLKISAKDEFILFEQKCAFLEQLHTKIPKVAASLNWSSEISASNLPANFSFVRVRDVARLGTAFLRLTLEAEDLSAHQDTSIQGLLR